MSQTPAIMVYFDYKSPYAFLAKDRVYELAQETGATVTWQPHVLDVAGYLGSATLAPDGSILQADRTPHQWRRIRYMFMDCRRQARKRGLTLRATQKIWDSSLAAAGMLFARRSGQASFRHYHDTVFERFWKRDLDIESTDEIAAVLNQSGADGQAFAAFVPEGLAQVAAIRQASEAAGVFGVPTFIVNDEIFWGGEHLPEIREMLTASPYAPA